MTMGKRNKVTTRDIAEYAGVSQSTVSMILSEKKNVSFGEETVENVKKAAKALGYHKPAKKKRTPDRSLSKTVMILCPTVSNGYYNAVIHSIVEKAQEYDYTTLTAVTFRSAEREDAYFKIFAENELAGVISLYPLTKYAEANALAKRIPVVSIGEKPEGIRFSSVELDSQKPGWMMAEHLVKLGHRHIAFISAPVVKKEISRTRRLSGMPQISLTTVEHSSWQKGQNAVELIYRKNTRREAGADSGLIIRMEYEPELIVRRTTGPVK